MIPFPMSRRPLDWLRIVILAGVLVVTGKQFSDCLTDCVKVVIFDSLLTTLIYDEF
jgi:hypothetical protein